MLVSRYSMGRMNSKRDKKRIKVEDDRLSSLPDDLIHKIFSFISIRDAIQASVLSSRWRFMWTSMPYLNFTSNGFSRFRKLSTFVRRVLSGRNNQIELFSVNLSFHGKNRHLIVEKVMEYALSHHVQQLNVVILLPTPVEFPQFHFSSRSLKHLSLTKEGFSGYPSRISSYFLKDTSTWELPALTTLYLQDISLYCDENTDKSIGFFSNCANLKEVTLKDCYTNGFEGLSICLPLLSNLTLDEVGGSMKVVNVVAPQLKNLLIKAFYHKHQYLVSAPGLTFLLYKAYDYLELSTHEFPSLEKADICITCPRDAHEFFCQLQHLHNVKFLTLNLEILEHLSSSKKSMLLMTQQHSPFSNLKGLKIYPLNKISIEQEQQKIQMTAKVKSYLLDSSPGAAFTMVSCETIRVMNSTKLAQNLIAEAWVLLEQAKVTKTKNAKMHEQGKAQNGVDIYNSWAYLNTHIGKERKKAIDIFFKLKRIKSVMAELPASNRASIEPSFSSLRAEAEVVMSKITDRMKMQCDENHNRLNFWFSGLATPLEPSS